MKRKAEDEIEEPETSKKQATEKSQISSKSQFREDLFNLEDQKERYAKSQPYVKRRHLF